MMLNCQCVLNYIWIFRQIGHLYHCIFVIVYLSLPIMSDPRGGVYIVIFVPITRIAAQIPACRHCHLPSKRIARMTIHGTWKILLGLPIMPHQVFWRALK